MSKVNLSLGAQVKAVMVDQGTGPRLIRVVVPGMQGPPGSAPSINQNEVLARAAAGSGPAIGIPLGDGLAIVDGELTATGGGGVTRRILSVKAVATANIFPGFTAGVWSFDYNGVDPALVIDDCILELGDRFLLTSQTSGTGNGVCVMVETTPGRFIPEPLEGWNYLNDDGLELSSLDLVLVENGGVGRAGSIWELRGNNTSRLLSPAKIYTPVGVLPENIALPFFNYSGLLASSETLNAAMFVLDALPSSGAPSINQNEVLARADSGNGPAVGIPLGSGLAISGGELVATGGGGGGGASSVNITGTVTETLGANTTYVCTATSSDYTVTMDTSGLSAGDVVTFVFPSTNSNLVTLSCAGGLAGQTTRVMRNGESAVLRWSGSTFERIGGINKPFIASLWPSFGGTPGNSAILTLPVGNANGENRLTLDQTDLDPGYGMADTTNNYFVIPRTGAYIFSSTIVSLSCATQINRLAGYFKLLAPAAGAGPYKFISSTSVVAGGSASVQLALTGNTDAGDKWEGGVYFESAGSIPIWGNLNNSTTYFQLTEVPSW